ncbi:hypothetical protein [Aequorivita sp. KMM 9714]|uniref:hypothetical protein n=1 Tax=Aequorivita sp. KMM 9714 TaxID=2707173 RepID=UPI0013EAA946|nr:hypothetical protein [Aequorivita sp. KMM 9714]NGX84320.1 hypothetical protein [Aequorivita sp. KMM 9714]
MILESNTVIQIQIPVEDVFEGIVNPEIMTKYFISESSGRLESGKEIMWKFPEFDDYYPVKEIKIKNNHAYPLYGVQKLW